MILTFQRKVHVFECVGIAGAFLSSILLKLDPEQIGSDAIELVRKASSRYLVVEPVAADVEAGANVGEASAQVGEARVGHDSPPLSA